MVALAATKLNYLAGILHTFALAAALPSESRQGAAVDWQWPKSRPYPGPAMPFLPGNRRTVMPRLAHYRTEPDHRPMFWYIDYMTEHRDWLYKGYWFISASTDGYYDGARIYDDDGELIWDSMSSEPTDIFRVCDYKGHHNQHICAQKSRFHSYILDNTYRQASPDYHDVGPTNGLGTIWDAHEFHVTAGGQSFTQLVIRYENTDLRPYLSIENGWVETSSFFEADMTGKPFFHWNAFDHLDLWETQVFLNVPGQTNATSLLSGDGSDKHHAWDFCHMNSVSTDSEGFYYGSARHLDAVLKIAGPNNAYGIEPGKIVWRLGGKKNDFKMRYNFTFSKQHDVRHVATTRNGQVISLFDNAWEGFKFSVPSSALSSGKVIFVNNHTHEATLLAKFPHPHRKLSGSRGGFDIVPNGNAVASWGHFHPELTEWTRDGTVLYHARYEYPDCQEIMGGCTEAYDFPFTYRGSKMEWHAWPYWKPKVIAYAQSCDGEATIPRAYASWNGATEIIAWQFFTADTLQGPWSSPIRVQRQGFETNTMLPASPSLPRWVKAEALDKFDKVLGEQIVEMFVPVHRIQSWCDVKGCRRGFRYKTIDNAFHTCAHQLKVPEHPPSQLTQVDVHSSTPLPAAEDFSTPPTTSDPMPISHSFAEPDPEPPLAAIDDIPPSSYPEIAGAESQPASNPTPLSSINILAAVTSHSTLVIVIGSAIAFLCFRYRRHFCVRQRRLMSEGPWLRRQRQHCDIEPSEELQPLKQSDDSIDPDDSKSDLD